MHTLKAHTYILPLASLMLLLTGCPEPECEGSACTPVMPVSGTAKDMSPTPDQDITITPDEDMPEDMNPTTMPDASNMPDEDMETLPKGTLINQTILTEEFGSESGSPTIHVSSRNSIVATAVRERNSQNASVVAFDYNGSTWQAETPFIDTLLNNATQLIGHDNLEPPSALYQSTANQSLYVATLTAGQWEALEIPNAFAGSTEVKLHALTRRDDRHVAAITRPSGTTNEIAILTQTGATSWAEPTVIQPFAEGWTIDNVAITLDHENVLHVVYAESIPDSVLTGGKDSRVVYQDANGEKTVLNEGGAYEFRPRVLALETGRIMVLYRLSDDLRGLPFNSSGYNLTVRYREPSSTTWTEPSELRNNMLYYKLLEGSDDTISLVGTDVSGDIFIRLYRNRSWSNSQLLATDYLSPPTSDTNDHLDAAFDSQGLLHMLYRTKEIGLAYLAYQPR